jgi:hypothetical protein
MGTTDDIPFDTLEDYYDQAPDQYHVIGYLEIIAKTPKAILFQNGVGSFWLPKSIITVNKKEKTVDVPVWCDWQYVDKVPPSHPYPDGVINGKQSNKRRKAKGRKANANSRKHKT